MQTSTHTHTPGPWKVLGKDHGARHLIITPKGSTIAMITGYGSADSLAAEPLIERREANARLIAAAPALLDALSSLFRAHIVAAHGDGRALYVAEDCDTCNEARAAIAAATGEDV